MKNLFTFLFVVICLTMLGTTAWGQLYDGFTNGDASGNIGGTGIVGSTGNGWTTHSGTVGTITSTSTSLSYTGLQASTGYSVYVIGNNTTLTRDVNTPISIGTPTVAYYSALVNIVDATQLGTAGDYFMSFGATAGSAVTSLGGRLGIKSSGSTFRFAVQNISTGTLTYTDNGADLSFGTTYLVVVKYDRGVAPTVATMWVNPASLGGTEPSGGVTNSSGTATFAGYASVAIRNGSGTPKAYYDEVRAGTTWASVTPAAAANSSSSDIIANVSFTYPTNIDYASNTGSNVTSSNPEVFELDIRDGGGSADGDALSTTLTAITFSVANSSVLEKVALYDGTSELGEVTASGSITFSGLSVAAADNGSYTLNLRATYKSTVTDNTQFSFTVTSATANPSGSTFAAGNAGGATSSVSGNDNRIEVTATKYNFSTQPPATTVVNTNFAAGVEALDANNNRDLDDATTATLAASAGTLSSVAGLAQPLSSGVYDWTDLQNNTAGTGVTLSATGTHTTANSNTMTILSAEPTTQATGVGFSNILTTSMDVNWTSGNGNNRIVIAKQGSAPTFTPTDGQTYTYNSDFTLAPDQGDAKVVYKGTSNTFPLSGLTQNTNYYVAVYEFNNPAGTENYLLTSPATGNYTTAASVSTSSDILASGNETSNIAYASYQASSITTTSDGVRLWSFQIRDGGGSSDGDSYGTEMTSVLITKGGSNGVSSWANTLRRAALFNGSTLVAELGVAGESISFSGLSGANVTASDDGSTTLDLYVTFETAATDNEQFQFEITNGNVTAAGSNSSLFAAFSAQTSSVTSDANRIEVTATKLNFSTQPPATTVVNTDFAAGVEALDANNNRDLDDATSVTIGASVGTISSVTGNPYALSSGVYNWSDLQNNTSGTGVTLQATGGSLTLANSNAMTIYAAEPTSQASNVTFSNITTTGMDVNWSRGNGNNCIVLMKQGSAVDANPADGTTYTDNAAFSSGSLIGTGNYVVYKGTSTSVPVTNLNPSTTYHVAVYEFNNSVENYLTTSPATGSRATLGQTFTSTASGIWSTMTWNPVGTPGALDNVIIRDGDSVTINQNITISNITVGQGTSGKLAFDGGAIRTVTVNDITIAAGGTFIVQPTGTYINVLNIGGNVVNNGTFDMSRGSSTIYTNVIFNKVGDQTISGSATLTRMHKATLNKGGLSNKVIASTSVAVGSGSAMTFTSGTWDQTAGTLSCTGTFTVAVTGAMIIESSGNFAGPTTGTGGSCNINGALTVNTSGSVTVGAGANSLAINSGATAVFTAGTVNVNGSFRHLGTTTIDGGTFNLTPQATNNNGPTYHVLDISTAGNFTMNGGNLTIIDPILLTGTGREIYINTSGSVAFNSGTIYLGDGSSTKTGADGFEIEDVTGSTLNNLVMQTGGLTLRNVKLITNLPISNTLTMKSGAINLNGFAVTYGASATLEYAGSSSQLTTDAEFPISSGPYNLTINNSSDVTLHASRTINGTILLSNGDLLTGSYSIDLGTTGILSETAGNTVVGNVTVTRTVASPQDFGGIGFEMNSNGTSPGSTIVTRVTGVGQGPATQSIKRYFNITPTNNSGLDVDATFHYDESELNGLNESTLEMWKSIDNGGTWTDQGGTANATNNYVTLNNVSSFSRWTLTDDINPLVITGSQNSDIVAGVLSIPTTISSLIDTAPEEVAVFDFTVRDGGGSADADITGTLLNSIRVIKGASNTVADWSATIQGAELFDGINSLGVATLHVDSLSWSGSPIVTIPDDNNLTLTVKIYLKTSLPAGSDGKLFEFQINQNANVTVDGSGSYMAPGGIDVVGSPGTTIDVQATQLAFTTQPQSGLLVGSNIAPVAVTAQDANSNKDGDYSGSVTLSSGTFTLASTDVGGLTQTASAGVASWTNLTSSTSGTGTVLADASAMAQGVSNSITVVGTTVTSVGNGNWSVGTTWDQGSKPTATQLAVIAAGHTVTLTVADTCKAATVQTGGVLDMAGFALRLHETFTLQAGAEAKMSAYNPLPGNGPTPYALDIASTFTFYGGSTGFTLRNPSVQTITFGNVNWSSGSNATPAVGMIIAGNLVKSNTGELRCGTGSTTSRTIIVYGNVDVQGGILTMNNGTSPITGGVDVDGNLTIQAGATLRGVNYTGAGTLKIGGNLINNGGTIAVGDGSGDTGEFIVYFKGTNNVNFDPGVTNAFRTVTIAPAKTVNLLNNMTVNATYTFTDTGTFYCGTNIVQGAGNFTLLSGATLGIGSPEGITTSGATGNIQVAGTRTYDVAANYVYNGSVAQVTGTGLPYAVNNLTINNSAGVTLTPDVPPPPPPLLAKNMVTGAWLTVNGILTLANGNMSTGAYSVGVGSTGTVSRISGHIVGDLLLHIPAGTGVSRTFHIGDASNYTPILFTAGIVTDVGELTATVNSVEHSQIATSGIDNTKSVNRYYTFTNNGVVLNNYSAVFNFVAGDVDPGASPLNFISKRYDGVNWNALSMGTRTLTSTEVTGVTSFSDFAIGEAAVITTYQLAVTTTAGGTITAPASSPVTVNHGAATTITAVGSTGYTFTGWTVVSGTGVAFGDAAALSTTATLTSGNAEVRANFTLNTYQLTVNATTGGTITVPVSSPITVDHGVPTTITVVGSTGYTFTGWTVVSGSGVAFGNASALSTTATLTSGNAEVSANFTLNTYQLTVTATTGGTITVPASSPVTVGHGIATTITTIGSTGYTFTGWTVEVGSAAIANATVLSTTATLTSGDATVQANFIEDPAYQVRYRTFMPESLALDRDNKGKLNKYVQRKPDKIEFEFYVVVDSSNVNDLHLEFGVAIDTSQFPFGTIPAALTMNNPDTRMKKWDITFDPALDAGDTVWVYGYGNKKTLQKVSKYWWTRNTILVGVKKKDPIFTVNLPRLPMPNRVNALYETFFYNGYAGGDTGMIVGKNRKYGLDSSKYYGWFQTKKYGDILKTLIIPRTGQMHQGTPHGFDVWISGKAFIRQQKSIIPTKYDNKLLAELIALKVNITASAMGITPNGFGELTWKLFNPQPEPPRDMMVKEISAYGDMLMMGQYDATQGKKLFASQEQFAYLDSVVRLINGAFEGAIDTSEFGVELHFTGTKPLIDVPWLRSTPGVIPAVITPIASTEREVPLGYTLYQNYPNPFNPTTTISFDLPEDAFVTLKVYNMLGQEVAMLLDREELYNGMQEIEFSADGFASGVYFYRIVAEGLDEDGATTSTYQTVKKMMLLK